MTAGAIQIGAHRAPLQPKAGANNQTLTCSLTPVAIAGSVEICVNLWRTMKVDFVIGGTQKGGTSALASFLRQHPEICMPEKKELHFFDREENFRRKPSYRQYHAQFKPRKGQSQSGEATPIYMYWDSVPVRIWKYNPRMKWIVILRDPAERAFSAWKMETNRGRESLSFAEAVKQEPERSRRALPLQERVFSYVDRGFYAAQLRRLFHVFGPEHCLVLLNEDLRLHHKKTLQRTFEFLGVSKSFVPDPADVFHHESESEAPAKLMNELREVYYFDIKELERVLKRDLQSWYPKR